MDDEREHWVTGLSRAVGLALAGFLLMSSLAALGALTGHAEGTWETRPAEVATADIAPDAIRRTAQRLDTPEDRWPGARSVSSLEPPEGVRGSRR
jgi:hypothetical protein